MGAVIISATVMAIFGVIGYQRGTKSSVFTISMILLELLVMNHLGNKVSRLVNGINYGVHFTLAGGLQALGGSGDKSEAIKQVIQSMGEVQPLIKGDGAGTGMALMFGILAILILLLGGIKWFRGQSSGLGLVLGLVSGYLVSAYVLGILMPEASVQLPLPSWLSSGKNVANAAQAAAVASSESNLVNQLTHLVTQTLNERTLAWIVVIIIVLFVFLATRFSNQGTKKG